MQKIETNESFTVDYQITEEDRKTIPDEFLEYYKYLKELKVVKEFKQKILSAIDKQIVPVKKPQLNKYGVGFIIGVVQDSMETGLNSASDVLFTATAEYLSWKKQNKTRNRKNTLGRKEKATTFKYKH